MMRECVWCSAPVETTRGQAVCKNCQASGRKRYQDFTPERKAAAKASSKKWRNEHRERTNELVNASRDRNRAKYTDYQREYKRKWRAKRKALGLPTQAKAKP